MEQDKRAAATLRLLKIMDELRAKCPWDRKQTFETLRGNTIEEPTNWPTPFSTATWRASARSWAT